MILRTVAYYNKKNGELVGWKRVRSWTKQGAIDWLIEKDDMGWSSTVDFKIVPNNTDFGNVGETIVI